MRKLICAAFVAAGTALAVPAFTLPAAAAPIPPMGVTAPDAVSTVQMTPGEHRMMRHRMERRMDRRRMMRHMERRRMRHHMERRMMRHGM